MTDSTFSEDETTIWDTFTPSKSFDYSDGASNLDVAIADNRLGDACRPKDPVEQKKDPALNLSIPQDLLFDLDLPPSDPGFLCPDTDYKMPLCCSGVFDGKNAGLCVPCMLYQIC